MINIILNSYYNKKATQEKIHKFTQQLDFCEMLILRGLLK